MTIRDYNPVDRLIFCLDQYLGAFSRPGTTTHRPYPGATVEEPHLMASERRHSAGLMRVNHAGEVSAQALYQGQSVGARRPEVRDRLQQSAREEADHLAWCEQRLGELADRTSRLNPLWGVGSFTIGFLAGLAGDKWSLGFVAETERQVVRHLQGHLQRLPVADSRSRVILEQMIQDESEHGRTAQAAGGAELPLVIRLMMSTCSKVMTKTAYYL